MQPVGLDLHAAPSEPVVVQNPPEGSVGQVSAPHDGLFAHVTSHAHALSHDTWLQPLVPLHETSHVPPLAPHVTLPQAVVPEQTTLQRSASQPTTPQLPGPVQSIVHDGAPAGHVTMLHAPDCAHVTRHGASSGHVTNAPDVPAITHVGGEVL